MGFEDLPKDLKNIVSGFAYDCKWSEVLKDLKTCEQIAEMEISPVFLRPEMWSWTYRAHMPNPLRRFEPIANFTGRWEDMIDWHAVNELMFRLDFRRKFVKVGGTRDQWFCKFRLNWTSIHLFDAFYQVLLYTQVPCFKPLYLPQGFNCLSSWHSPFQSARWILEEGGHFN